MCLNAIHLKTIKLNGPQGADGSGAVNLIKYFHLNDQ